MNIRALQKGKAAERKHLALRGEILADVAKERERQESLWGSQTFVDPLPGAAIGGMSLDGLLYAVRRLNDGLQVAGRDPHLGLVLLEEVFEALTEQDPVLRAEELIQVAAVAVSGVEDLRSRG